MIRAKIGPYTFDDPGFEASLGKRETRKLTQMENGARYIGEWLVGTNTREGKGQ